MKTNILVCVLLLASCVAFAVAQSQSTAANSPQSAAAQSQTQSPTVTPQQDMQNTASQTAQSTQTTRGQNIQAEIQKRFASNPALANVQASVNGGSVTLTGSVPSEADKAEALHVVQKLGDVRNVEDNITVGPPTSGSNNALPQSDENPPANPSANPEIGTTGKGSQSHSQACQCGKDQVNGKFPGTDEPCSCNGAPATRNGETVPPAQQAAPAQNGTPQTPPTQQAPTTVPPSERAVSLKIA